MRTIQETYEKLHNGDEYLLDILDEIIEYKVTRGEKSNQVEKILSLPSDERISCVNIILAFVAFATASYLYYFQNIEIGFVVSILVGMVGVYVVGLYFYRNFRYNKKYNDYFDVNRYVEHMIPMETLEDAYWNHHGEDDGK